MPNPTTVAEAAKLIGKTAILFAGTVEEVHVTIKDIKQSWGNFRAEVQNANGVKAWRNLDTLKLK